MRRLRSDVVRRLIDYMRAGRFAVLAAGLLAAPAIAARAQTGSVPEGGLELLLPMGARTVAMGQTGVVAAVGSDALWWNPALISRGPREAALQITSKSSAAAEADAGASVSYFVPGVGAVAISARYINEGFQQGADTAGNPNGTFVRTATVVGASFAAPFGDRFAFGFTAKIIREGFDCSGTCNGIGGSPLTSALDLGAQYFLTKDSVLAIGAAARDIGFDLQVHDSPQADPLPARAEAGIEYAPKFAALPKEARVRATADIITRIKDGDSPGYRFGAELSWMDRYQGRVGYVVNGPTASGATFGFGLNTGKLQIDFAQMLSDLGDLGARPTFVTLRYLY